MPGRFFFPRRPSVDPAPPPPVDGEPVPGPEDEVLAAPPPPPPPPPRPISPQRERRELARRREVELRDIGGLAVEMARRDDWRYPLLHSRCAEVLALEERIHELDALITAATMVARGVPAVECRCGAPILHGSHFCSHCGRPAPETPPVTTCSHCGQPLPAEANFCSVCGNGVAAEEFERATGVEHDASIEDTFVEPAPAPKPDADER
jgi:hypothetical protein